MTKAKRSARGRRQVDTDADWQRWGERDPYFGVITDDRFRQRNLTLAGRTEFFQTGEGHVQHVFQVCRKYIDADFSPKSALDFGCGVGRVTIPLARIVERVVGLDVAESMLNEARKNQDFFRADNVEFLRSDDSLSAVSGSFDLVHSMIVFQHLEAPRGRDLFRKLLSFLAPRGICAAHFTYGKTQYPETFGATPATDAHGGPPYISQGGQDADPLMLMNAYNINELLFVVQTVGIRSMHVEFTDHGGELGVVLYFQKVA